MKFFLLTASISGFLAVALGAFGAHALKDRLSEYQLGVFKTGVDYQMVHSLLLAVIGTLDAQSSSRYLQAAGVLIVVGIFLFSGSLYAIALTGVRQLGAITPFGGLCFLASWILLGLAVWRR